MTSTSKKEHKRSANDKQKTVLIMGGQYDKSIYHYESIQSSQETNSVSITGIRVNIEKVLNVAMLYQSVYS